MTDSDFTEVNESLPHAMRLNLERFVGEGMPQVNELYIKWPKWSRLGNVPNISLFSLHLSKHIDFSHPPFLEVTYTALHTSYVLLPKMVVFSMLFEPTQQFSVTNRVLQPRKFLCMRERKLPEIATRHDTKSMCCGLCLAFCTSAVFVIDWHWHPIIISDPFRSIKHYISTFLRSSFR